MSWRKSITKKERKHMAVHGVRSHDDMKIMRERQKELDPDREVCWDCRSIAVKLGIEN